METFTERMPELIGSSLSMGKLDSLIKKMSETGCPALIQGEFGVEKLQIAQMIHDGSRQGRGPFLDIPCAVFSEAEFIQQLPDWLTQTEGGTLFLNGIDRLSLDSQRRFARMMKFELGQWVCPSHALQGKARLITSGAHDLREQVSRGKFSKELLAELSLIELRIPPLRDRLEDLCDWIRYFLKKYQKDQDRSLSEESLALFLDYSWPENLFELEKVLFRLASFSESPEISAKDVREFAPELLESHSQQEGKSTESPSKGNLSKGKVGLSFQQITIVIIEGKFSQLQGFHPSLYQALHYISEHYKEEITTSTLTKKAQISLSYLSYLFKENLGISCKNFLCFFRIEKAKFLLEVHPEWQVTEIAYEVGFNDLSYFQRTFKQWVGMSPNKYRKREINSGNREKGN